MSIGFYRRGHTGIFKIWNEISIVISWQGRVDWHVSLSWQSTRHIYRTGHFVFLLTFLVFPLLVLYYTRIGKFIGFFFFFFLIKYDRFYILYADWLCKNVSRARALINFFSGSVYDNFFLFFGFFFLLLSLCCYLLLTPSCPVRSGSPSSGALRRRLKEGQRQLSGFTDRLAG